MLKQRFGKKGFTMAELLIVVAIIAILVAIALPVFGAQLNKARHAVDVANVRSLYSEAVSNALLTNDVEDDGDGKLPVTLNIKQAIADGLVSGSCDVKFEAAAEASGENPAHPARIAVKSFNQPTSYIVVDADITLTVTTE